VAPSVPASTLALSTDLRNDRARRDPRPGLHVLGLLPGGGNCLLLSRAAGLEAAAALTPFGEEIDGERAVEIGLAGKAVQD